MDMLAAMRAYIEIVEQGSLTKAAEKLGKSLPTVVRVLAALEAHLGARLLVRTTRRMSLTPEGRDFLERSKRILGDVAEAEAAVVAGQTEPQGTLRVTAPVLFGQMHVAPVLAEFAQRFPRVTVELVLLDRIVDLVEEGIDAAIRLAPLEDSTMIAIRVGEVHRVVVASPALLDEVGMPRTPSGLAERPCVLFSGTAPGARWRFADAGREFSVPIDSRFRSNHAGAALEACVAGLGFGQFLSYQAAPYVGAGRLRVVLEEHAIDPIPASIVYPGGRLVSARLRACLDWLRNGLRERSFAAEAQVG